MQQVGIGIGCELSRIDLSYPMILSPQMDKNKRSKQQVLCANVTSAEDIFTTQSVRERIKRPICIKGSLRVVSNGAVAPILPLLYFIIIILALLRKCVSANQFGGLGLSCLHDTVRHNI